MDTLFRDLRYAVHSLRRTPGFTTAALLILALGIRMSTAMFTVFKTVLVDRLPIGLYGIMATGVRRQTHEIGVRVALGAMPGNIRRLVVGQVVGVVGIGVIGGLGGALATSRLLRSLLFNVSPIDPLTLVGVCVLLLAVAMIAAYLPARRAARIDPVEALRAE